MTEPDYKARLLKLTLVRLAGLGVAAIGGALIVIERLPQAVHALGGVLVIAGLGGMFFLQRKMFARWRDEDR